MYAKSKRYQESGNFNRKQSFNNGSALVNTNPNPIKCSNLNVPQDNLNSYSYDPYINRLECNKTPLFTESENSKNRSSSDDQIKNSSSSEEEANKKEKENFDQSPQFYGQGVRGENCGNLAAVSQNYGYYNEDYKQQQQQQQVQVSQQQYYANGNSQQFHGNFNQILPATNDQRNSVVISPNRQTYLYDNKNNYNYDSYGEDMNIQKISPIDNQNRNQNRLKRIPFIPQKSSAVETKLQEHLTSDENHVGFVEDFWDQQKPIISDVSKNTDYLASDGYYY